METRICPWCDGVMTKDANGRFVCSDCAYVESTHISQDTVKPIQS